MEPFEVVYGILVLVATQEEGGDEENFDKDNFFWELEVVLQNVNRKGGFDNNTENSF